MFTRLTCMCDMTRSFVWHDSFLCVMTHFVRHRKTMSHVHTSEWVMPHKWTSHVTHTRKTCHVSQDFRKTWMSHVTHMNESCHVIWMSHDIVRRETCFARLFMHEKSMRHAWRIPWMNLSHIWMTHVTHTHTHEWVVPRKWISQVTRLNESFYVDTFRITWTNLVTHTYEWVMSRIWVSHVTHMNQSCHTYESGHTYEWVTSNIWASHVTHMSESCHTYDWVISHIRMSPATQTNASCHAYKSHI